MPLPESPIMFADNPLNRMGQCRPDSDWVAARCADADALFVPFWHLSPLILPEAQAGMGRDVGWLPRAALATIWNDTRPLIFLGINRRDKPLFAIDVSDLSQPEDVGPFKGMGLFEDVRALAAAGDLPRTELAILAQAKAMLDWHIRHGFCAQCGQATHLREGGYKRVCARCDAEHFPRTDPVVIMLAIHDDACLVGRQKNWPEGMFSALAGFMEPGETIEEAVARELAEEAGIDIDGVRYIASQPWPFPASLMIGCIARATSRDITLDGQELEEAKWVNRPDMQKAIQAAHNGDTNHKGQIGVPPPMAIARQLIDVFAANKASLS